MQIMTLDKNITMTSLEVAEITGKNHADILRDIRDEIDKLGVEIGQSIFAESSYLNSQNKKQPMYNLTRDGVLQLGARYDAKLRFTLIQRMNKLEEQLTPKVPTSYKEALLELVKAEEEKEKLQITVDVQNQIIEEFKPKKEYLDAILSSDSTLCATQIAADYGLSARTLHKTLFEHRLIRKVGEQWILYCDHMNKGYTKSDTFMVKKSNGTEEPKIYTRWTQKGRLKIHEILTSLGILANFDKETTA